jgi:hypothetical protein
MLDDFQNKDIEIEVDWGKDETVPDGTYEVAYVSHEAIKGTFGAKLKVVFRILDFGEHYEKKINSWYNIDDDYSPKGKNRKVKTKKGSKLTTDMLVLSNANHRKDRLTMNAFKNKIILVKTRLVIKDGRQKNLHQLQKYSVVDSIIGEKI